MKTFLRLLCLTLCSALFAAALLALRPPQLPTLVSAAAMDGGLENALEQALIKQVNPAELTEQSINATLAAQPATVGLPSVACTLQEGVCSLYLTWQVMGQPLVARVDLAVRREGGVFVVEVLRGAYGQLQVPRGMLMPLRPVLQTLQQQHAAELTALFAIPRFRFAAGKLVLAPKF